MPVQPPAGIIDSIDQIAPAASFTSPAAGSVSGIITLAVTATDYDVITGVQFKVDGTNIGAADTSAPYQTSYDTRALLNGSHTFSAVVTDRVGNQTTITQVVTFANVPVVTINTPANGAVVNGASVPNVTITSYDATISSQLKIDGANVGAPQTGVGSVNFASVDTRGYLNGDHTWSITSTDGHGNVTTATVTVNHENAPLVSITAPGAGGTVSGNYPFAANVTSYDGSVTTQFRMDGVAFGASQPGAGAVGITYDTRTWINGTHTLSVLTTDGHGNTATASISVTVAVVPTVAITSPANGATLAGLFNFYATVTSYDAVVNTQFKVDGANLGGLVSGAGSIGWGNQDSRSWLNGAHTLSVTATDGHGNSATATITVTIANVPVVAITAPGNGATVAGNFAFQATVTSYDASISTQFYVDGAAYGAAQSGAGAGKGFASVDSRGWLNGSHTLTVISTDGHGNATSVSVTVNFANAPVISITAPGNGATVAGNFAYTATITHYDSSCSTAFKIDGTVYGSAQGGSGGLGYGSVDSRSWLNGSHTLQVTSQDAHGNTTNASVTVTFANAPAISITAPSNSATATGNATFSANVTSYDATVSTQFKIDAVNVGGAQSGSGAKSVIADSRSWANGWHTYAVTSTDGHGNATTVSVSVYHRNAPAIGLVAPGNGAVITGNTAFKAAITHYSSGCNTSFRIDGNQYNGLQGGSGTLGWDAIDTHIWGVGWHTFTVVSTDAEGNSTTLEYGAYVNNQIPGGAWKVWGDLQIWDGANWVNERSRYPTYDTRWNSGLAPYDGGGIWSGFGPAGGQYPAHYLPGNPDPTHYQMRIQMYIASRFEGGTDGNRIRGAVAVGGIGELWFYDNGPYSGWSGLWNVNGGESCVILRWGEPWGDYNYGFTQGIQLYYDFVLKPGYAS